MEVYLDASAILPLFISDAFSQAVEAKLENSDASLLVSDWVRLEVITVITKRGRARASSASETKLLIESFETWVDDTAVLVTLGASDVALAIDLVQRDNLVIRGPDALHLAIAARFGASVLTFDKAMAQAATEIGVGVVPQS